MTDELKQKLHEILPPKVAQSAITELEHYESLDGMIPEDKWAKVRGLGKVGLLKLKDAGLIPPKPETLSARSISVVGNKGIPLTKEAVRTALLDGRLRIGHARNYGQKTDDELRRWVDLQPLLPPSRPMKRNWLYNPFTGKPLTDH